MDVPNVREGQCTNAMHWCVCVCVTVCVCEGQRDDFDFRFPITNTHDLRLQTRTKLLGVGVRAGVRLNTRRGQNMGTLQHLPMSYRPLPIGQRGTTKGA